MEPFVYEPDGADLCGAHDRLRRGSAGAAHESQAGGGRALRAADEDAARLPLRRHHRDRRHPGRDPRAHLAARRPHSQGVAAEALAAKWFEKSPEFTDEQNLDQLRQSLDLAIEHYKAHGADTPFGLFAGTYREQQKKRRGAGAQSAGRLVRSGAARPRDPRRAGQGDGQFLRPDDRAATCRASPRPSSRRTSSRCHLQRVPGRR